MNYWFLCKVSYTKELEDGTIKRMKDNYLTDATTLTEAEARMHEEVGRSMRGEFSVAAANRMNFVDVFTYPNVDNYYKCKIRYVTIDEAKGKEREVKNQVLIAADDLLDAHTRLTKEFSSMLVPYEIIEIIKTPLVEVFRYKSPDERVTPNLRPISEVEEVKE